MNRRWLVYIIFFGTLLLVFYFFLFREIDPYQSKLAVINSRVQDFSFVDQSGRPFTEKNIEGKVYVAEYFFTTCKGICPKMNANMRRVYDVFKNDSNFAILSHTCMPETDSVPLMKAYAKKMMNGAVAKHPDGSYFIEEPQQDNNTGAAHSNWFFLTGDKNALYKMARYSYIIDKNSSDSGLNIADQFIHTQFFSLVDKQRRVRGIYDGTRPAEVDKMISDCRDLLREKYNKSNFLNNMGNTPN